MAKEIAGKVVRVGRVKDYGHETNFGKDWQPIYKFFMQVESKEFGKVNAMVECEAEQNHYGFKIPEDSPRQKPFVGDTVKFTTHTLKNGWASVTFNQIFKFVRVSKRARKERDKWVAEQKKKREEERVRRQKVC